MSLWFCHPPWSAAAPCTLLSTNLALNNRNRVALPHTQSHSRGSVSAQQSIDVFQCPSSSLLLCYCNSLANHEWTNWWPLHRYFHMRRAFLVPFSANTETIFPTKENPTFFFVSSPCLMCADNFTCHSVFTSFTVLKCYFLDGDVQFVLVTQQVK